jgi:hypothetical protein
MQPSARKKAALFYELLVSFQIKIISGTQYVARDTQGDSEVAAHM